VPEEESARFSGRSRKNSLRLMICSKVYLLVKCLVLPWSVLKSQVVVRKEKPKEEGQDGDGKTALLKGATVGTVGAWRAEGWPR